MNYNTSAKVRLVAEMTSLLAMCVIGIALFFLPFWGLWNWLMPLFGISKITLLQSVGLYLLLRIILFQPNYTNND